MAIGRNGERDSKLQVCVDAAATYLLSESEARDIVESQLTLINEQWSDAADTAHLTALEREQLWGQQILNPFIFYDWTAS
jgi:serine/threonine-protein kinase HipA